MIQDEFNQLMKKYSTGEASEEEVNMLNQYYELFDHKGDLLEDLNEEEIREMMATMKGTIVSQMGVSKKVNRKSLWRKISYAAAAAIVLLIGVGIFMKNSNSAKDVQTGQVVIEKLENRVIILPDGSMVYLKGDSKLSYPSTFEDMERREVTLEGEGFFDIRHNPLKSFVVKTGSIETVVLGTAFNIRMGDNEDDIVVTVKRGKVKVLDEAKNTLGVLTQDQQIVYKKKESARVTQVANDHYLDWRDQDLIFENVTLSEAAHILEERFKVNILIEEQVTRQRRFTATFMKNESLEKAIKTICAFNGTSYQYDSVSKQVVINPSSPK